jgi:hypothetical protein
MKRLCPRHELILHRPLLLVGEKLAVLDGHLLPEFLETGLHQVRGGFRIEVVDGELEELSAEKPTLDGTRLGVRKEALAGLDFENSQSGLISGKRNGNIQRMFGSPSNQFFRRIAPAQPEGRLQHGLCRDGARCEEKDQGDHRLEVKQPAHGRTFTGFRRNRKARSRRRGTLLIEAGLALSVLTFIGLVLLKLSLNILAPRQWGLQQTVTDAYMTFERSYAERIPFENLTDSDSPWPAFPATSTMSAEIGRLPGDRPIYGIVTRTRLPSTNNFPIDGGSGTLATNPAAMKVWKVQSVVTYKVGGRNYAKSRTVLRSQ